ncbi:MAG: cysteine desulfurase [Candidatus Pacebacteria bacterium]|nr:cysteine desulfurase [Candidatus Paceibacterota bacterium]
MKKNTVKSMYLDHAATTPTDPRVFSIMKPYLTTQYENPSALYRGALKTRKAIEDARKIVADFLGTQSDTIYFTSGGTESVNVAVLGTVRKFASQQVGKHIITTQIEHHAVLEPIRQLEKEGYTVTYVPVDENGLVTVEKIEKALRENTVLVSIMYANNEIGSIQPIADIGRMLMRKKSKALFHTDACQATQFLPMKVDALHVDLLSFNGSKIYGPKGAGVLYKRRGVEIEPIMYGGGQERGLRSGTEDVASIVGLGKAVELIAEGTKNNGQQTSELRDYFWKEVQKKIDGVELNGPDLDKHRLANNLNVAFEGCDAEALILYLDAAGVQCSAGSACTTDSLEPSHVLKACGYSEERARSSVRFTLGRRTTKAQLDYVVKVLVEVVEKVRNMSELSS